MKVASALEGLRSANEVMLSSNSYTKPENKAPAALAGYNYSNNK